MQANRVYRTKTACAVVLAACLSAAAALGAPHTTYAGTLQRSLGRSLSDLDLITALADASLADAYALLAGAAEQPQDRPQLVEGLLHGLPRFQPWARHTLAARYLQQSYFDSHGLPRTIDPPLGVLSLLNREYVTFQDPALRAVFLRLCSAYRVPPSTATLMDAGAELLQITQRSSGLLDAAWGRVAREYFMVAPLRPDPALARLIDEIRRALRDRHLVVAARTASAMTFHGSLFD
ncbi:MAG: hypothetical protein EA384_04475 [Spirochaetaceae bacterium]|nr:MAG: hypothetical protein EA384_04475 [Spirochaetaceae bacterium]